MGGDSSSALCLGTPPSSQPRRCSLAPLADDAGHLPVPGNFSDPPKLPSALLTKPLTRFFLRFSGAAEELLKMVGSHSPLIQYLLLTCSRYYTFGHRAGDRTVAGMVARQNPRLHGLQPVGSPCIAPQCPPLTGAAGRVLGTRRTWKYVHGAASLAGFVFLWTF